MRHQEVEVLAIGAGPANLALGIALEELAPKELAAGTLIIEQHDDTLWQRGMLLPWTQSQVSFLKDLVTLRNPRSEFSFVNYLHTTGRLDEFINLGTFTPYRSEISGYLQWVASSLSEVRVEYGRRCVSLEPGPLVDGEVSHWLARTADGAVISSRNLVIGAGRDAHVPAELSALPEERVIHSTRFSERIEQVGADRARRIVVIGGAQSAAELLWAAYQRFPEAQCTMLMRSIGLNAYQSSKFTNELFYPSFIDDFFATRPETRSQVLREMHVTNYAGLAPAMLETLYREMYQERLRGTERLRMRTLTDVAAARMDGDEVVLTTVDRKSGDREEIRCDLVLLGTGFVRDMPAMVRDLAAATGAGQATVDRAYRMVLPESYTAGCYLQGVNEATHGIADSLLSVLASRSQDIVTDLLARRGLPADEALLAELL
ncbi:lysine N(6)-hydroxylase/L-ornithine N(5)-oxygenase family protein [Streptomyces sp. CHA1]|uniref:SidA/IucD/PvdA family monooxygenase n=1 Tax=Streptomyces TaxID=1883 RepID=UPI0002D7E168|nr:MULTISPECIES: SidA/IucD/PvdA family monooxygenase [Streptomyces]WDV31938.1 lysine N(6)-hydroxylase/L-ornithine N(5)-oxygenase family protein [Streptomyces sp. AD16]ESQ04943.1 lysine/ornithine N-monooxygenase [Streptomyces sp. PVA_94-07]MBP3078182.1 L-lysine 6-monooxygenase [Streptomyces sp. 604F]MBT3157596.1 lysine N(6)-hydroxylase/L-ornithine N(5)-oxygenase family protein [Streptomyces sp. G11C]MCO6701431.1 lysine N(6)-hydroxylase/L-ornithine N(5)-oxygenase family protein [Streptomyces sp.